MCNVSPPWVENASPDDDTQHCSKTEHLTHSTQYCLLSVTRKCRFHWTRHVAPNSRRLCCLWNSSAASLLLSLIKFYTRSRSLTREALLTNALIGGVVVWNSGLHSIADSDSCLNVSTAYRKILQRCESNTSFRINKMLSVLAFMGHSVCLRYSLCLALFYASATVRCWKQ